MSHKKFAGLSFDTLSEFIDLISILQKKYKVQAVKINNISHDSRDMYVNLQGSAYIEINSKYGEYTEVEFVFDEDEPSNKKELLNTISKYIR